MATVGHGRGRCAQVQGRGQGQLLGLGGHHAVGAKEGRDGKVDQVGIKVNMVIMHDETICMKGQRIFHPFHTKLVRNQTLFSKLSN